LPSLSDGDIISTIAGDGRPGFGGDGGLAILAKLNLPSGVAVDASGNVYIADTGNSRIRMVAESTGKIFTKAGGGFYDAGEGVYAGSTLVFRPSDIAVDPLGNIYIAEPSRCRIRLVTKSTGSIRTVAGDVTCTPEGEMGSPDGIAIDALGNIYIAEPSRCRIRLVTKSTGSISTVAGDGTCDFGGDEEQATLAKLNYPQGVAVGASGNVYIADTGNNRIRMVTKSTGTITTVAGDGSSFTYVSGSLAISTGFGLPGRIAVDASENIIFSSSNRVLMVTKSTGIISTVAGNGDGYSGFFGDGGSPTLAKLRVNRGLCFDASGNIYIADAANNRIRKITPPSPTEVPSESPTEVPSESPTEVPSESPTEMPTSSPTEVPTSSPTASPSSSPTEVPTSSPTEVPTSSPTVSPIFPTPSCKTNSPISPTTKRTKMPVTAKPTKMPVTAKPTKMPVKC
jgi:trimeric autotransporter adhesin